MHRIDLNQGMGGGFGGGMPAPCPMSGGFGKCECVRCLPATLCQKMTEMQSFLLSCTSGAPMPPMGMMRSMQSVGAPMMQPYQQMQCAPPPMQMPAPVPQSCTRLFSRKSPRFEIHLLMSF